VHVITKWRWRGVGVGEEEPTRNYIKLVVAPQMGQRIVPNTIGESRRISFLKLSGNSGQGSLWFQEIYFTGSRMWRC